MKKQLCCDCDHRILEAKDSISVHHSPLQWTCKKDFWQDMSICLECSSYNWDWGTRCSYFKRIKK
jgi:hypothetical protein